MPQNDLARSFQAQGDGGAVYTVVETRAEPRYALRDGTPVRATGDGLYRIETTGEILTPRGRAPA